MSEFRRREFLASVGSLAVGGLAGCTDRSSVKPHVVLSVSEGLVSKTTESERTRMFEVCEDYIVQALESRVEGSVCVEFDSEPYDVSGSSTQELFDDFDSLVSEQHAVLSHICLCGDVGDDSAGRAEITDAPCSPRGSETNVGVVTNAHSIQNRYGVDVKPALRVRASEIIDYYFANRALGTLIHEIGHNLCLSHEVGQAWYGVDAPDLYAPVRDEENIYFSPMLGFYYYSNGGLPNVEDEVSGLPTFTGAETLHYGVFFPPSV